MAATSKQQAAGGAGAVAEAVAPEEITEVIVEDYISVRDLATLIGRSPIDLIKILMQYGIMAPITHSIDHALRHIIIPFETQYSIRPVPKRYNNYFTRPELFYDFLKIIDMLFNSNPAGRSRGIPENIKSVQTPQKSS